MQLTLIAKSNEGRYVGRPHASVEQASSACDPGLSQESVRREAERARKRATQVELVRTRVVGERVEGNVVREVIEQEFARAAHAGSQVAARRSGHAEERRERRDGFRDRDVECEWLHRPVEHQLVQPPERPGAVVVHVDLVSREPAAQALIERTSRFVD